MAAIMALDILVIADTHIPSRARGLPAAVLEALPKAGLILHAGDFTVRAILRELERHAPVVAVAGNNDDRELASLLPVRTIVPAGRFRIGLVHGDGTRGTTYSRAAAAFAEDPVDCVVFGHSHQPLAVREGKVLYLNPGSPTDRRRQPRYSYAWLRAGDDLSPELVYFESRS